MELSEMTLDIQTEIEAAGPIDKVFERVLYRLGEGNAAPDGTSLDMRIEPFAGGRWYRDRGNGVEHLWGHVQTIRAPQLIEFCGPMFMSYPALNHVEVKLAASEDGTSTRVTLRHRAVGMIDPNHRAGINTGWNAMISRVAADFAAASADAGA